jgi:hypothetical protein
MFAGVHEPILVRSIQVDHLIGEAALFSWTLGSVFMDMWIFGSEIYIAAIQASVAIKIVVMKVIISMMSLSSSMVFSFFANYGRV